MATKDKKTVPVSFITDEATDKKVKLNWNHEHPVCPECAGQSAGTNRYCGTCKGHGTVAPKNWTGKYGPGKVTETAPEVAETAETEGVK